MLHKKDIKTGNIVPIYTEHQSMEGLTCMALLLEKDKSFDQSVFIKEERDPKTHLTVDHTRLTLRRGQIIYHKNAQTLKWGLYFLSQIGTMSMTLDSVDNSILAEFRLPRHHNTSDQRIANGKVLYITIKIIL